MAGTCPDISYINLTVAEKLNCLNNSLDNSFAIIQALFPSLLGHGLHVLSQDRGLFIQSSAMICRRLTEENRDGEQFLTENDKTTADFNIRFYRRRY
jgi:hypothetical protein